MLIAFVFCASFLFQTFTTGLQNAWLDDLDGPKFLRGAGQEIQDDEKLDSSNDSPNYQKRGAGDYVSYKVSENEVMISNVAAPSNGTWTTRWDTNKDAVPLYMFPDKSPYYCGPFPTMVQFDKPSDVIFIPPTVRLLRCVGGCDSTHNFRNCTVVSQEEVVLTVWELGKYSGPKNITVYNHTKCACSCIKRKSDCDEKIRVYNEDTCDCDCKYDKSSCNLATHDWSTTECECKCKAAPKHCDGKGGYTKNHEWNPDICDCDCTQRVKDRCVRKGKVLNKSKCECECKKPLPVCVAGTKFLKSNCTCVKDTSVITK